MRAKYARGEWNCEALRIVPTRRKIPSPKCVAACEARGNCSIFCLDAFQRLHCDILCYRNAWIDPIGCKRTKTLIFVEPIYSFFVMKLYWLKAVVVFKEALDIETLFAWSKMERMCTISMASQFFNVIMFRTQGISNIISEQFEEKTQFFFLNCIWLKLA